MKHISIVHVGLLLAPIVAAFGLLLAAEHESPPAKSLPCAGVVQRAADCSRQ